MFLFVLILFRSRYFITFCIINWNIKKVLNKKHCYFFYKFYLLIYKMYCLSSQHDIWRQKVKTASEWGHNNWFVVDNLYNVKKKTKKNTILLLILVAFTYKYILITSDLWRIGGFLRVLRFPPSKKLTATI